MLERTKRRLTENSKQASFSNSKGKSDWRDVFSDALETHTEQGLYLKGLRLREGYTQAKLGELIGVSQNNVSAMEHGKRSIGKEMAHRFASVFKVNYQRFL